MSHALDVSATKKDRGTQPRLYNEIVRKVTNAQGDDVAQNARLFVLINAAMARCAYLAFSSPSSVSTARRGCVRYLASRGLWQMIEENGRSQVFFGMRWMFDAFAVNKVGEMDLTQKTGGARIGLDIANATATNRRKAAVAAGPDSS